MSSKMNSEYSAADVNKAQTEAKGQPNSAKKMYSIARRINASFVGRFVWHILKMDVLICVMALALGVFIAEKTAFGTFRLGTERSIEWNIGNNFLWYKMTDTDGSTAALSITKNEAGVVFIVGAVILVTEFFSVLVMSANMKNNINDKLLPIRQMAKKTEKLTNMAYNEHNFKSLEAAIENVNATSPDAKISTDNRELQGIENALNHLLERMRETYRQQSRFVSDASHELRTPIAVIRGYADMLDRWGKEDESILDESIEAIKNESEHMQKLVEQLLFLARGDSGRNNLQIERIQLDGLMGEVFEESKMIDTEHVYEFCGEPAVMDGDVSMIKQCARILIDNAAKYTQKGDTITIRTGQKPEGVFFSVQDNGIGMHEADVSHVFERFYRSDEARGHKSGGTGLGLSIAKWIVDRHNGYFNILTRPDIGTRITVIFVPFYEGTMGADEKEKTDKTAI